MNSRRLMFLIYYIVAAGAIVYFYRGSLPEEYRLATEGKEAQAKVSAVSCSSPVPVAYAFTVGGKNYEGRGESGFGNPPCEALKQGFPLMVYHLPGDPMVNKPGNPHERLATHIVGLAIAGIFIPLLVLVVFFLLLRYFGLSSRKTT